jgi:NADH-quinone oxidoreductase subunit C
MSYSELPGFVEQAEAFGETTVTVEPARIRDACLHARNELGFQMLGDLNFPSTQGLQTLPEVKARRFSVAYHLLALRQPPVRVRLKCWLDDGEPVPSVVSVWPTADWHEREQFDLMGIRFDGHPNLKRLIMDDDWEGHPLRKDYPIGGEPVRFSEAE